MSCLSPSQVEAYVKDTLRSEERAGVEIHVETCNRCREALYEREFQELNLDDTALLPSEAKEERAAGEAPAVERPVPSDRAGAERLGPYVLLSELGRGGQGQVYLAEDTRLGRKVALKVLPAHLMRSAEIRLRFEREAAALSRLDHPGICAVYETGEEEGTAYIAMRFVDGESLALWIAREARGGSSNSRERIGRMVSLIERAARALHAAHEAGLVHRDIKPGNIMVTREGEPVIVDFGLVRDERGAAVTLTRTGDVMGTPAYMSPEQVSPRDLVIDRRTDVYSLGATLYEAVTLRLPFDGPTFHEIQRKILSESFPNPMRFNRFVSRDLRVILEVALEKERARRYQTALDLAEDLSRLQKNRTILARRASTTERAWRWCRRNPVVAGLSSVVLGLLLALVIGAVTVATHYKEQYDDIQEALLKAKAAEGLRLTAQSNALLESHPGLALLLAVEGAKLHSSRLANNALLEALKVCRESVQLEHHAAVKSAAFSPDGMRVVTACDDRTARIWDARTGRAMAPLRGHGGKVSYASFRPDGKGVVTVSDDGTAIVWDAETGDEIARLEGHDGAVSHTAFSPDGKLVVTASDDGTAIVWDAETGDELTLLAGHGGAVRHAAFGPDGERVVTASMDATARIWGLHPLVAPVALSGHEAEVLHAELSPDGARAVTASADRTARIWDAVTGKELAALRGHGAAVSLAAFSPNGKRVLTASRDDTVRLWDLETRTEAAAFRIPDASLTHVDFSRDARLVLAASTDRTVRVWDVETAKEVALLRGHEAPVQHAAFTPDGTRVATAAADRTARIWDLAAHPPLQILTGHGAPVTTGAFSGNTRRVVTASGDRTARVWDAESGKQVASLLGHEAEVLSAELSPDGKSVVTASRDMTARAWDAESGEELATLRGHTAPVTRAVFSPDGKRVLSAGRDTSARIWDVEKAEEIAILRGHRGPVAHAELSPNGRLVLTASADGTARVWEAETGTPVAAFRRHAAPLTHAAFSPGGQHAVTTAAESTAWVWDTATGAVVARLGGHGAAVSRAVFSPDGRWVATASRDGTGRVWDATKEGVPVAVLEGHEGRLVSATFSADGKLLATASDDRTARVWDLETGAEIVALVGHLGPVLAASFSPDGRRLLTASAADDPRIWRLDMLSNPEGCRFRSFTAAERDLFGIGTPEERARHRHAAGLASLLDSMETEQALLRRGFLDPGVVAELESDLERLAALERSPSESVLQRLEPARQAVVSAIRSLERAHDGGGTAADSSEKAQLVEELLEKFRNRLLPDLATFASIEAALKVPEEDLLLAEGSAWRYFLGRSEPSPALEWTAAAFDDASWEEGPSPFGYGLDGLATSLAEMKGSYTSAYCRVAFDIHDPSDYRELVLSARVDDGFVAYLNGEEVGRVNAGAFGERLTFDSTAAATIQGPPSMVPEDVVLPPTAFRPGRNVLALHGLNAAKSSSDFILTPTLRGRRRFDLEAVRKRFAAFLQGANGQDAPARKAYLEGRLLQRAGRMEEAALKLEAALDGAPHCLEPYLVLEECTRALGEPPTRLEARLRKALVAGGDIDPALWDFWFRLAAADPERDAEDLLALLPPASRDHRLSDLRWILQEIASTGRARINCGGRALDGPSGAAWGRDRFFTSGERQRVSGLGKVRGTTDEPPLFDVRSFPSTQRRPGSYSIPLPHGAYTLSLHFVESAVRLPFERQFTVAVEGEHMAPVVMPGEWGLLTATRRVVEASVTDGFLDVSFVPGAGEPEIAAIEVEKRDGAPGAQSAPRAVPPAAPAAPENLSPADGAAIHAFPVVLRTGPYRLQAPGVAHWMTRWQVRAEHGTYEGSPLLDHVSESDLEAYTVPAAFFLPGTRHFWRAAHISLEGGYSAFGDETSFSVSDVPVEPVPFDIAASFNSDLVVNDGDIEDDPFDGVEGFLVEEGLSLEGVSAEVVQGLPHGGTLGVHKLGDYDGPNALQLHAGVAPPVVLEAPERRYAAIRFLVSGAPGNSALPVTFEFADSSLQESEIACSDWFSDHPADPSGPPHGGSTPVWNGMDHLSGVSFQDRNDPALFEVVIPVDPARPLRRIVLLADRAVYALPRSRFYLFAVTGMAVR